MYRWEGGEGGRVRAAPPVEGTGESGGGGIVTFEKNEVEEEVSLIATVRRRILERK